MKKKTAAILILFILCLFINREVLSVSNCKSYESILKETKNKFFELDEFKKDLENNFENAMFKIRAKAKWLYETQFENRDYDFIDLKRDNPSFPNSSFPQFKQINSYYCGPASALTALYFQGNAHRVHGSGYSEKQITIGNDSGTNSLGTVVYKLTDAINLYSNNRYFYDTNLRVDELDRLIYDSLNNGNAPILHALMEYMPYYSGRSGGHYVSIVYYDWRAPANNNGIEVMDNNYDDRFFGVNRISLNDIYDMLNNGRYIIGAPGR